ncbi:hypothetical protein [Candidatus Nitrosopumilus koreensis]|nr:hypothetical protein [Candidatus Nitrosopumilus koreensis]
MTKNELISTLQMSYEQLATSALRSLKQKNFVHESDSGYVITRSGIDKVEKIVQNI